MEYQYIGIDVSKGCLDVNYCGEGRQYLNDPLQIKQLIKDIQTIQSQNKLGLVICEATGGYEQKIVRACHESNIPMHVAHANKVRYFAKSRGILAKTDKIDAFVLSDYARLFKPAADSFLLTENVEKIKELLKRKEQLQEDKKREVNRSDKILSRDILDSIKAHIEWLNKKIKEVDEKLSSLEKEVDVKDNYLLLTSIASIGKQSAYYLLAYLPEIGQLSNKALAALVGVAPYNQDSGGTQGKRFIKGGRANLRKILYMASLSAIRYNPDLKVFYDRLCSRGKPAKVALIAVMHKLITLANSVIRRQKPWEEKCPIF